MVDNNPLEDMKFIVKVTNPTGTLCYWEGIGECGDTTLDLEKATVFTWKDLTDLDKEELRLYKKVMSIIPVYKEI